MTLPVHVGGLFGFEFHFIVFLGLLPSASTSRLEQIHETDDLCLSTILDLVFVLVYCRSRSLQVTMYASAVITLQSDRSMECSLS